MQFSSEYYERRAKLARIAEIMNDRYPDLSGGKPIPAKTCLTNYLKSQREDAERFNRHPQFRYWHRSSLPGEYEWVLRSYGVPNQKRRYAIVATCCIGSARATIIRYYAPLPRGEWLVDAERGFAGAPESGEFSGELTADMAWDSRIPSDVFSTWTVRSGHSAQEIGAS